MTLEWIKGILGFATSRQYYEITSDSRWLTSVLWSVVWGKYEASLARPDPYAGGEGLVTCNNWPFCVTSRYSLYCAARACYHFNGCAMFNDNAQLCARVWLWQRRKAAFTIPLHITITVYRLVTNTQIFIISISTLYWHTTAYYSYYVMSYDKFLYS